MRMIRGAALLVAAALAVSMQTVSAQEPPPPILRPSPEFKIRLIDNSQITLSSFRGKVVAFLFMHTTCPHCQHAAEVVSHLYSEYGARGFQPVGVTFNSMANLYVRDFIKDHNVTFPVGFDTPENVMNYLGFSIMDRYVVPQIVWIDRKGNIRSQTSPMGDDKLLQESYWRNMIETLTKEPADSPKTTHRTTTTTAKKGS
jgi:peroxiredoxin